MESRSLGYEDAASALDLVGRRHRWLAPAMAATNKSLSFVFLDTTRSPTQAGQLTLAFKRGVATLDGGMTLPRKSGQVDYLA